MEILGIDIGGSGIKGAPVEVETGILTQERWMIATPQPSVPDAVADVVAKMARYFAWQAPIGCTFPAVIKEGIAYSAANVDKSWLGTNGEKIFAQKTQCPVLLLNDGDAAGLAEMEFGVGKGRLGVVIVLTFGTGIGTSIFVDGHLVPNTEFGHMEIRGKDAEHRSAARIRIEEDLDWKGWAERVNEFLGRMEQLFSPDLFVIGGGISQQYAKFLHFLNARAEIVPAHMHNDAGIIGAALAARKLMRTKRR